MGIFDVIKKSIFTVSFESKLMKTISGPVFIKDLKKESDEVARLKELLNNTTNEEIKKKLENEVNLQGYLQDSLGKVYFELKNSTIPFYALSNIRLEQGDSKSNIDFLVICSQFCCLINSKSHGGNIEIDSQGSFSRWIKRGDKSFKEGMYSPVEENRRAELLVKEILAQHKLEKLPVLSLAVFTSPKATLNFKDCAEDFKEKVIKVDLLNTRLKAIVESNDMAVYEEKLALELAEIIKLLSCESVIDYEVKFKINKDIDIDKVTDKASEKDIKETLLNALKTYRTAKATEFKIPPYYIYNNEEMDKIIEKLPKNKAEVISLKGFGEVKFEKYGEDIINIIKSIVE